MVIFLERFSIVIFLLLIQFTLLPYLGLNYYLDLLLIVLFYWTLNDNAKNSRLYLLTFCSGLLFDLISGCSLGVNTFFYLFFVFFLKIFYKSFLRLSEMPLFFIFSFIIIAAFIIVRIIILRGLGISSFLDTFWWQQILANTLLINLLVFTLKRREARK